MRSGASAKENWFVSSIASIAASAEHGYDAKPEDGGFLISFEKTRARPRVKR